ncbi:hypothetical protein [Desulfonatronum lacustre]|uniref:hypothetical protein n=1 Tax=Desulfonatronum lacustre TaxID=66849 RepID=UPI00048CEE81|nr:hypothetical protein [Desulfonatronum lacustre]
MREEIPEDRNISRGEGGFGSQIQIAIEIGKHCAPHLIAIFLDMSFDFDPDFDFDAIRVAREDREQSAPGVKITGMASWFENCK